MLDFRFKGEDGSHEVRARHQPDLPGAGGPGGQGRQGGHRHPQGALAQTIRRGLPPQNSGRVQCGPTGFSHCSDDYAPTSQCETLLEEHEEDIEEWYFKRQEEFALEDFLCRQRALTSEADKYCLGKAKGESGGIKSKRKTKKKKKDKDEL